MYVQVCLSPSLFATEIIFLLEICILAARKKKGKKSYLFIAVLRPDNKKLVSWYSLEKLWDSRTVLPAPESRFPLVLWWAIPFRGSFRPEEQQVLSRMGAVAGGAALLAERQRRLLAGNSYPAVLMQVVHLSQTLTSYLWSLNEHELPHPGFAKMTQMQMRGWPKHFQTVYIRCYFEIGTRPNPPRGR